MRTLADTQYGTSSKASEETRGKPVLRMNNITYEGRFDTTDLKWVELSDGESEKLTLRRGDLLFNRTNSRALVGKTGVWQGPDGYTFAGYLVRVRLRQDRVLPRWVSAFMNSPRGKTALFHMAKPSINMANISASDLLRLRVPVPPIEHQRSTITILDKAEAIRCKRREGRQRNCSARPSSRRSATPSRTPGAGELMRWATLRRSLLVSPRASATATKRL